MRFLSLFVLGYASAASIKDSHILQGLEEATKTPREAVREAVGAADKDGDGMMDSDEFQEQIRSSPHFGKVVFEALDVDRDGQMDAGPFEAREMEAHEGAVSSSLGYTQHGGEERVDEREKHGQSATSMERRTVSQAPVCERITLVVSDIKVVSELAAKKSNLLSTKDASSNPYVGLVLDPTDTGRYTPTRMALFHHGTLTRTALYPEWKEFFVLTGCRPDSPDGHNELQVVVYHKNGAKDHEETMFSRQLDCNEGGALGFMKKKLMKEKRKCPFGIPPKDAADNEIGHGQVPIEHPTNPGSVVDPPQKKPLGPIILASKTTGPKQLVTIPLLSRNKHNSQLQGKLSLSVRGPFDADVCCTCIEGPKTPTEGNQVPLKGLPCHEAITNVEFKLDDTGYPKADVCVLPDSQCEALGGVFEPITEFTSCYRLDPASPHPSCEGSKKTGNEAK